MFRRNSVSGCWHDHYIAQHINILELKAVHLAFHHFLPYLQGQHMLVRTGSVAALCSSLHQQTGWLGFPSPPQVSTPAMAVGIPQISIPKGIILYMPRLNTVTTDCQWLSVTVNLCASQVAMSPSQSVVQTLQGARTPSTRALYAHRWKVFVIWCREPQADPLTCSATEIPQFLWELLDAGKSPSTLRQMVAAVKTAWVGR